MTPKMVASFRRSLSFPNHPTPPPKSKKTFHVRSTSLPCRTHPLISQLKDGICELQKWAAHPESRSSAWLCDGLSRLKIVHESLDDLIQLPQTRESLSGHSEFVEKLLEDFLRFVDVYGTFQTLLLALKEEHSAAQVAVRRKDDSKMPLYVKGLKKIAKEMEKIVYNVQSIGKNYAALSSTSAGSLVKILESDAELTDLMKDVIEVTTLVSVALFNGLSVSLAFRKSSWMGLSLGKKAKKMNLDEGIQEFNQIGLDCIMGLKKKGDEELKLVSKRMHELEDCISGIEVDGERVFRSLINARVSLLNVLTQ